MNLFTSSIFLLIIVTFSSISIISYLLGSINFSIIVTRLFGVKDIRTLGSGNAGFTNVLRLVGVVPAILTFLGDFLKAIIAILTSRKVINVFFSFTIKSNDFFCELNNFIIPIVALISGIFVIFGHIYPCFFEFKGGKAIVCLLPITLLYNFKISLLALGVFLLVLVISRIVSLSSIIGTCSLPFFNLLSCIINGKNLKYTSVTTLFFIVITVLVIYKHLGNIRRIRNNTEYKLGKRNQKV